MSGYFDPRGCLTPAGLAALERAPAGQGPPDVAQHVAACPRCQARVLAGPDDARQGGSAAVPTNSARLWRLAAVLLIALGLALGALVLAGLLRR